MIIAYVLAVAGAAAALYTAFQRFVRDINYPMFDLQIDKLVLADNVDRAKKLCSAAPKSAHVNISKAAIEEAIAIRSEGGKASESMARERLLEAYRAAEKAQLAPLQSISLVVLIAIGLAGGGIALAVTSDPIPTAAVGIASISIAIAVWGWMGAIKIATGAAARRESLIDKLLGWLG